MGTKKIDNLSDQQVAKLAIYQEKWLNIGLNTEPTYIPAAEAAVKLCYKLAGLTAPQSIICVDSPLSSITIDNHNNHNNHNNHQVYQVSSQVFNQVWNQVYQGRSLINNQITNQVYNQVGIKVNDQVWNQVLSQVSNQIWNQVSSQVLNHVSNQVWSQVRNRIQFRQCYGCHEAGVLAIYDYFREVCGITEETEEITGLIALAKCCGWWTPYENVAIIQHRPCAIHFDDKKRIHCESGMAIKYRDGFGVWAIHGVRVDEQIVMKPNEQTIKQITEEGNAEKKRIRIERFGWNRYLTKIGAKVIDRRHNDIENTCETLVKTPDGMTILLPTCKTGRLFSLEVPFDVLTCEQAQNWLHSGSNLDSIIGKTRVTGRS